MEEVFVRMTRGDWEKIAKIVYRLWGVERWVWEILGQVHSPYWLDESLWHYKYILMDYIGTKYFSKGVCWQDLDDYSEYSDLIDDMCNDFYQIHDTNKSPTSIKDEDLDEFVNALYDALIKYCDMLQEEQIQSFKEHGDV